MQNILYDRALLWFSSILLLIDKARSTKAIMISGMKLRHCETRDLRINMTDELRRNNTESYNEEWVLSCYFLVI